MLRCEWTLLDYLADDGFDENLHYDTLLGVSRREFTEIVGFNYICHRVAVPYGPHYYYSSDCRIFGMIIILLLHILVDHFGFFSL
jgi:hypothetical protein